MPFTPTVTGAGGFTATVNGQAAFLAGMSVVGLKGDTGPAGPAGAAGSSGVVYATVPLVYDSVTKTVSMDVTYFVRSPLAAGTDGQILSWDAATSRPLWVAKEARTVYINGTNKTGATIAKGKAVYISGATGSHPEITLAQANSEATSARTIGVTAEEIAVNGTGKVITSGVVENVDTGAYTAGQVLYLSPTTAGGFVTSLPTQPYHGVVIGYVTRANNSVGVIEVHIQNYQELRELSDVLVTSVVDKDLLVYESSSGVWKNKSISTLDLLTATSAAAIYQTQAGMASYLTISSASATYQTQAGMTDYLSKAGNLSGLASVSTARTNLGLGTAATSASTDFAAAVHTHTASQISDSTTAGRALLTAADASAQRTSLGLGTMATETASNYAPLASPALTGTPTAPTASVSTNTTQLATTAFVLGQANSTAATISMAGTQAAGTSALYARADHVHPKDTSKADLASPAFTGTPTAPTAAAATNTTQIATTAFVQQEVPAASTSTAGKVQLATDAQAFTKTDGTKSITPLNMATLLINSNLTRFSCVTADTGTSGTGGTNGVAAGNLGRQTFAPTSTGAGYIRAGMQVIPIRGGANTTGINWSRPVRLSARIIRNATTISTESIYRFILGEPQATNTGDIPNRGIGIKVVGTNAMQIMAHDGTTLTTYTTSHTPANSTAFDLLLVSDGSGNVEAFVNGSSVGSTTGGPTGSASTSQTYMNVRVENTSAFTSNPTAYYTYNICTDIVYT